MYEGEEGGGGGTGTGDNLPELTGVNSPALEERRLQTAGEALALLFAL